MRRTSTSAAVLALLALVAACSGSGGAATSPTATGDAATSSLAGAPTTAAPTTAAPTTGSTATGQHNNADIAFVTGMIPHHRGAIQMAALARDRAGDQGVKDLATAITGAQGPEIALMTGWLQAWGQPVPDATATGGMSGDAGMAGMSESPAPDSAAIPGMMSQSEMAALAQARGADFDRRWLAAMTSHHLGAVQMARTELGDGSNQQARQLAQQIITSQTAEIRLMGGLLQRLGS